jgi:hypothetical protein
MCIALRGVTVSHLGAERLFVGDDLRFEPRDGGGPLCSPDHRREAPAFGLVNVAHHLQRGLDRLAAVLPALEAAEEESGVGRHASAMTAESDPMAR